jgi:hypothetical protein
LPVAFSEYDSWAAREIPPPNQCTCLNSMQLPPVCARRRAAPSSRRTPGGLLLPVQEGPADEALRQLPQRQEGVFRLQSSPARGQCSRRFPLHHKYCTFFRHAQSGELWHSGPCSSGSEAGEDKGQNHVAAAAFGDYDVRVRASWSQTGAASFGTSRRVGHGHAAVPRSLSLTWRPISSAHVFFRDQYGPHQEIPLTIDLCATLSGDIISNSTFSSVNLDFCSDQC